MIRLTLLAALAVPLVACVTPELPTPGDDDDDDLPAPDAMPPPPPDAPVGCEVKVQTVGTGYHNPGQNCLDCHNGQQQGAPVFTLGGTAYRDRAATVPATGSTVVVIDGNGLTVKMPVMQNGNFYTSAQLSPPYVTYISECPDNVPMIANFVDGDCNSCHEATAEPGRIVFDP